MPTRLATIVFGCHHSVTMLQTFNEKNCDLIVNINGKLLHRDQAGVSPFDSSVQGGDAVWEGLRLYRGKIFKLIEHLDRLRHSALALAFAEIPSHEKIIGEIKRTLAANKMPDNVHLRLMLTRVDGRQIGNGEVGAMTRKLAELFRRLTEIEGVSVV